MQCVHKQIFEIEIKTSAKLGGILKTPSAIWRSALVATKKKNIGQLSVVDNCIKKMMKHINIIIGRRIDKMITGLFFVQIGFAIFQSNLLKEIIPQWNSPHLIARMDGRKFNLFPEFAAAPRINPKKRYRTQNNAKLGNLRNVRPKIFLVNIPFFRRFAWTVANCQKRCHSLRFGPIAYLHFHIDTGISPVSHSVQILSGHMVKFWGAAALCFLLKFIFFSITDDYENTWT